MNKQRGLALIVIVLIIIVLLAGGIFAWQYWWLPREKAETLEEKIPMLTEYGKERLPNFEDFPIFEQFEGTPVSVDLSSHPEAPKFKTRLTEGARGGPNFAGHYTIVSWGCGTECQVVAVVDAKTGVVYFPPFVTELGIEFRIDSNLFIVNPPNTIEEVYGGFEVPDWVYSAYYKWENNQFVTIFDTRIADWKTYQSEKFSFEFKYPSELEANSSGPNEEQKKLDRGETISGTVPPLYDTITFSNSAKKEQFNVMVFPVSKNEVSLAGFKSYLSMGSVCDTRWIDSVSGEPTLLNKNGISILEVQVISGGPRGGSSAGCYYFKNSEGNLAVFNISGFEQKSDFLNVFHLVGDKILSTLSLLK